MGLQRLQRGDDGGLGLGVQNGLLLRGHLRTTVQQKQIHQRAGTERVMRRFQQHRRQARQQVPRLLQIRFLGIARLLQQRHAQRERRQHTG